MSDESRLDGVLARYREIEGQLAAPDAHKDLDALQSLGREQARLRPVVDVHHRLEAARRAEAEARELLSTETDPEMVAYLKDELHRQHDELERLEGELPMMLVPVLAAQYLTTREPDGSMMEVAIAAFSAVRSRDLNPDDPEILA